MIRKEDTFSCLGKSMSLKTTYKIIYDKIHHIEAIIKICHCADKTLQYCSVALILIFLEKDVCSAISSLIANSGDIYNGYIFSQSKLRRPSHLTY